MKHATCAMIPRGAGSIISTSSVASVMGGLGPHAYTASKHAIVGLTKNAACELGRNGIMGIRVHCISRFSVATSMLINTWRRLDDNEEQDEILEQEVEKSKEFMRSLANLKGVPLKANDVA
ncbi:unnamed protein product [Fraxinus pennsylvanica]|uniref:Uncharacterized protein n=1 Tax=Fraxinus pennsylvanica TaxID=56036 RepID=A0AAD2A0R4_9LAMI|nr:unnamed protein product [Fraxinus pennsylvanica]